MKHKSDERLDQLAITMVRAAGLAEKDAAKIGGSPFIRTRLLARIEAERKSGVEQGSSWFPNMVMAWRAIAVLLLVTIAATFAFWMSRGGAPIRSTDKTADDVARVVTGGTCALSSTDECAISREEVLATLFAEDGGKERK